MPCKYQRMIRDGKVTQRGDIDTHAKFASLMAGIPLKGKTVLDVGCNCGEMCRLATDQGARTMGIDSNRVFIEQARQLHPKLPFQVKSAAMATGKYDVAIASAMFHHSKDHHCAFFARMARVVREVLVMDVWLIPGAGPATLTYTQYTGGQSKSGAFIPNKAAFRVMSNPWFGSVEEKGIALSPDDSQRWIYHLRKPKPAPLKAVIIYGRGGAGKSTYAKELLDHAVLQLDHVFIQWYRAKLPTWKPQMLFSVEKFVDDVYYCGDADKMADYQRFYREAILHWLRSRVGSDVVIEGYDMVYERSRHMVIDVLHEAGWPEVSEVALH